MKLARVALLSAFAVLVFASGLASALCICPGGPSSEECKQCSAGGSATPSGGDVYKAFKGSLAALALECGVSEQAILDANGLSAANTIQTGARLRVPGGVCASDASAAQVSAGSGSCYLDQIKEEAKRQGLDPCLILAIMQTESGCNPRSVGGDGECGLMQLMPQWFHNHAGWGRGRGILPYNYYPSPNFDDAKSCYVPQNNIAAGVTVFRRYWNGNKIRSLRVLIFSQLLAIQQLGEYLDITRPA